MNWAAETHMKTFDDTFYTQIELKHTNIPSLLLQYEMGLHKKLDPQSQSTGRQAIHLLADAVPQIQPQVLSFAACELQAKVVHFNNTQLSANLDRQCETKDDIRQGN